jgi:LPS sulfotransferase NodH
VTAPPLFVLGVRRSGTTLLRVMLDRHSKLAIPDESYFIPQLADRHRGPVDVAAFVDDLRRIGTLREWDVDVDAVAARLQPGLAPGDAIAAVYLTYAAAQGKERWGDKTPLYMEHLATIDRLFPDAVYVHLIRDGRDAAVSFLEMPAGVVTETWAHPRDAAGFACQWRAEVSKARALGRRAGPRYLEVRYEALVADPEGELRRICAHVGLDFEPAMLAPGGHVPDKPHQQSLKRPPTVGLRDWRTEMTPADARVSSAVAGDLLAELGYPDPGATTSRGKLRRASYAARVKAWNASGSLVRRTPLWARRHPPVSE